MARFEDESCVYDADLGNYSNSLEPAEPGQKAESVRVAGFRARLVTGGERDEEGRYFIGVHLPSVSKGEGPALTVTAYCTTREAQTTARDVLVSLELDTSHSP